MASQKQSGQDQPSPADHQQGGGHQGHQGHQGGGQGHSDHHAHMMADFRRRFFISVALTVPVAALSPMLSSLLGYGEAVAFPYDLKLLWALATVVFFYGGWPFLKGLVDEVRQAQPGMMTLIGLAITVAYVYSSLVAWGVSGKVFFWELASLIDIMLLGHWIEMRSVMGASRALEELAKLVPKEAHRLQEDGSTEEVPVAELARGDKVLIKPGEQVPVDGEITEGRSSLDESMLTGESTPVEKSQGGEVIGGSINGEGSLTVEVQATGEDSYLSKVISLVEEAQKSKSRAQNLADRAAMWLTFVALGAGALTMLAWLILSAREFVFALERTVTVMVITCPHALGLAVPLVVAVSTALAARRGFLIRNRTPFEKARQLQAVVFDKTGTLTKGEFGVQEVIPFGDDPGEDELLKLAASVESRSEHPIARGIARAVEETYQVEDFQGMSGRGAKARVQGREVQVVSLRQVQEDGLEYPEDRLSREFEQGRTVVFVLVDGRAAGAVSLADMVREESQEAVRRLKDMGVQVMMLTGDNQKVAAAVAGELGLDDYFAEVLPEEKADRIKEVQGRGLSVAMTGDGVNDAPALAQADVGLAIGAGTDVAVETADIVLVKNNPLDVVAVIQLSRATFKKTVQNLFWATGYNAVAIPLAAGVLYQLGIILSPAVGALLMSLSTVIVAINAKFLQLPESAPARGEEG
jgi:Cu2+-exporting ATPase